MVYGPNFVVHLVLKGDGGFRATALQDLPQNAILNSGTVKLIVDDRGRGYFGEVSGCMSPDSAGSLQLQYRLP